MSEIDTVESNLHPVQVMEEVVKDGQVITQFRDTVQLDKVAVEQAQGNPAMSINHPDFVPASERVYTYDETTGMSTSKPKDSEVLEPDEEDKEETEEETDREILQGLIDNAEGDLVYLDRDYVLDGPVTIPAGITVEMAEGFRIRGEGGVETLVEGEGVYVEKVNVLCLHPVGNGECQLPSGHEGQHRLNVD